MPAIPSPKIPSYSTIPPQKELAYHRVVPALEDKNKNIRYKFPQEFNRKARIKIENSVLKRKNAKEIIEREVLGVKKRVERMLPPINVAHHEPYTIPLITHASSALHDAPLHRYTTEAPEIHPRDVKVRLINRLKNFVGEPINDVTLANIQTSTGLAITNVIHNADISGDFSTTFTGPLASTAPITPISFDHTGTGITGTDFTEFEITIRGSEVSLKVPNGVFDYAIPTEKEIVESVIKRQIKQNLLIKMGNNQRKYIAAKVSPQELKARETLRDMITESEWRRYVTNGFIMVKAGSGYWYQIFNSGRNTQVYKNGKRINSICIHTDRECPLTDHVINMKIMAELDETAIWRGGNVHQEYDHRTTPLAGVIQGSLSSLDNQVKSQGNLVSLYKSYKKAS